MKQIVPFLLALLLGTPAAVQAQFGYSINAGGATVTITNYTGPVGTVVIPTKINNLLVTGIGDGVDAVFTGNITNVAIPSTVTSISPLAFINSALTSIAIPTNVLSIGNLAFFFCTRLTNATISNGVTSIDPNAFASCTSLPNITIPGSVTNLGTPEFPGCSSLASITVIATNPFYSSLNGVLFDKSQTTLVEFPGGPGGNYTIPASVSSIGAYAFEYCANLTGVVIPAGATNIGDYAFDGCSRLASLVIPNRVAKIGINAFYSDIGLTNVVIPASVTSLGNGAFWYCTSLTGVILPASVSSIGNNAFEQCFGLTSFTIPKTVTNIGVNAFSDCTSLTSACFAGDAPAVDSTAFTYDTTTTAYYLPGTVGWTNFSSATGVPSVLWNPLIQNSGGNFGLIHNQFGFNITGTANLPVTVVVCTNLASPVWIPLTTNMLVSGLWFFSDLVQPAAPRRFYGLAFP